MPVLSIRLWFLLLWLLFACPCSPQTAAVPLANVGSLEPEQVRLSEILISAPQSYGPAQVAEAKHKAQEVRNAIQLGGVFADLARANSEGPSAARGGDLGYFKRGVLDKPIEEQVFRMKVGDVSEVVRTKYGFLILQVTERDPDSPLEVGNRPILNAKPSGLRGSVVDKLEHAPISNVYVLAHRDGGTDVHVRTDKGGKYSVQLPPGIYDVFVSADRFPPTSRKVEITPDGMMVFDAVLEFNGLGMQVD